MAQTLTDKPISIAADDRSVALEARLKAWLLAAITLPKDMAEALRLTEAEAAAAA